MMTHMISLLLILGAWGNDPSSRVRDGFLEITLPENVLADEEVVEQLSSGLTTTFRILVGPRRKPMGGARIDIRYELWDEVYLVGVWDAEGQRISYSFASREALISWWKDHHLKVMESGRRIPNLKLALDVIPFSTTEQNSAQRWVTQTQTTSSVRSANISSASPQPGSYLDRLLATSIQRKPLIQFSWRLPM